MGFIKDFLARRKEADVKLRQVQEDDRVMTVAETRKLSHDERELIKSFELDRREALKEARVWDARKRAAEDKLRSQNLMKFNPEFFTGDTILKEKHSFLRGGDF